MRTLLLAVGCWLDLDCNWRCRHLFALASNDAVPPALRRHIRQHLAET